MSLLDQQHIGIDAHYIGARAGGNETYMRNLLAGLAQVCPYARITALTSQVIHRQGGETAGFPTAPIPTDSSYLRVPFVLPWMAKKYRLDLLHVQYTAPPICPVPYVVTMHDIVAFRFPESMPFLDRHRLRRMSRSTLKRARRIFTVTEAMRTEISSTFHIDPAQIDVVPNALAPIYNETITDARREAVRQKYTLPEKYILYVGLLQPRKNLMRLAEAFARLREEGLEHTLVIVGKRAWLYGAMLENMEALNLWDHLQFTDYVDTEDLPVLYNLADVFTFVSLYEGFGIPVIEALACGTPVLASTDPALMEVTGGGALYPDPLDIEDITEKLRVLINDTELRKDLVAKGQDHIKKYSIGNMGQAAETGYKAALES